MSILGQCPVPLPCRTLLLIECSAVTVLKFRIIFVFALCFVKCCWMGPWRMCLSGAGRGACTSLFSAVPHL